MVKLLELHTAAEHGPVPTQVRSAPGPKLETLPRPNFTLDMTQADWSFKESQWQVYISQHPVTEQVKIQQLKAACDEPLYQSIEYI